MDKFINYITRACKFSWNVFSGFLGIIFILITVVVFLTYLGIILMGESPTRGDGYPAGGYDPFS
jgi:magnesium-transporting ATPase (P-type)